MVTAGDAALGLIGGLAVTEATGVTNVLGGDGGQQGQKPRLPSLPQLPSPSTPPTQLPPALRGLFGGGGVGAGLPPGLLRLIRNPASPVDIDLPPSVRDPRIPTLPDLPRGDGITIPDVPGFDGVIPTVPPVPQIGPTPAGPGPETTPPPRTGPTPSTAPEARGANPFLEAARGTGEAVAATTDFIGGPGDAPSEGTVFGGIRQSGRLAGAIPRNLARAAGGLDEGAGTDTTPGTTTGADFRETAVDLGKFNPATAPFATGFESANQLVDDVGNLIPQGPIVGSASAASTEPGGQTGQGGGGETGDGLAPSDQGLLNAARQQASERSTDRSEVTGGSGSSDKSDTKKERRDVPTGSTDEVQSAFLRGSL